MKRMAVTEYGTTRYATSGKILPSSDANTGRSTCTSTDPSRRTTRATRRSRLASLFIYRWSIVFARLSIGRSASGGFTTNRFRTPGGAVGRIASVGRRRVQEPDTGALDIANIARDQDEVVHQRRGRQEPIHRGDGIRHVQTAPEVGHAHINRQYPLGEVAGQPLQPLFKCQGRRRVTAPDQFDAPPDLAQDENTGEQLRFSRVREPGPDPGVRSDTLAELREDVGVDQSAHRDSRGRSRLNSKSSSDPTSGIDASAALNEARSTSSRRAAPRISRCSASAEWPCRAARRLSAPTISCPTLRTISWLISSPLIAMIAGGSIDWGTWPPRRAPRIPRPAARRRRRRPSGGRMCSLVPREQPPHPPRARWWRPSRSATAEDDVKARQEQVHLRSRELANALCQDRLVEGDDLGHVR